MDVQEEHYIGTPNEAVPTVEPTDTDCMARRTEMRDGVSVFVGYCRAWPGKGTDHVGQGRCDRHGGAVPTGEDSPHFEHGLFSDHLGEQDRETIAALEEYDDAEKLDELVNWRLARLRRAVRALNEDSQQNFWAAFSELVEQTGEPEADQIKQLAKMLSSGNRAMQDEIDLVRKLIKDHNQIAEGDTVQVEHSGQIDGERTLGDEEKEALRNAIDPTNGSS